VVLGAIYDEGKWWYADPSIKDMQFGECKPFICERVYLVGVNRISTEQCMPIRFSPTRA
jgi:hypothetical protein